MIEIKGVSKSYQKGEKVIDGIDLKINDGEIFGFLGPNGAGKTTTINMIMGILEMDDGQILIDGKDISKKTVEAKMNMGYVPDNPDMFLKLKGIEYLNFIADIYNVTLEERKERIEKISKEFDMYDALNSKIETYSHGMKQKILVIGVLIHNPKNWILDEPMTGLDPKASFELKNKMKEHAKKGNTVFFSTHVLDVAEKLCDRIAILNKGKIVLLGSYNEIKEKLSEDKSLEDIFIEITREEE
ncbi:MAG: ABC transporter ATP-binding protein [Clostridia bacterium]|nr:ABC transporter ATP-binding protein [Clostridia bacterium]